jgi:hypothetical protein
MSYYYGVYLTSKRNVSRKEGQKGNLNSYNSTPLFVIFSSLQGMEADVSKVTVLS